MNYEKISKELLGRLTFTYDSLFTPREGVSALERKTESLWSNFFNIEDASDWMGDAKDYGKMQRVEEIK